jgi:nucleoside-diphosphate-sugar epimerase
LTGGTGFLGRWISDALEEDGYRVRLLARGPVEGLRAGREIEIGRLGDADALERLVLGADVVVHAAGLIKARRAAEFIEVNVEGSRRLAGAATKAAPDAHVILVSSIAAREPQLSDYASSKAAAEAAMREALAPERLTIVRPPAVYGPGDRETLALFRSLRDLPVAPLPGRASARLAMIHAADAARQIAALAQRAAVGATYVLSDSRPEGYSWSEVMQAAGAAVGRRPTLAPLPSGAILAIGAIGGAWGALSRSPPMLTLGKAREMLHPDWGVRPGEQAPNLPMPRFDLDHGFQDAVSWYRRQGWL